MSASEEEHQQWEKVRSFLKRLLIENITPASSQEMCPKQVWEKYKDDLHAVNYGDKSKRDKFSDMLRSFVKNIRMVILRMKATGKFWNGASQWQNIP